MNKAIVSTTDESSDKADTPSGPTSTVVGNASSVDAANAAADDGWYTDSSEEDDDDEQVSELKAFKNKLEFCKPLTPDEATEHFLEESGFRASDKRVVRLISLAGQQFVTSVIKKSITQCKKRTAKKKPKQTRKRASKKTHSSHRNKLTSDDIHLLAILKIGN